MDQAFEIIMVEFGLIGKKLSHSFSKEYFEGKFIFLNLTDHFYHLFELNEISGLPELIQNHPALKGLNVTIPYKEDIIPLLNGLDDIAEKVGAVNVVKVEADKTLSGFNTDFYGFKKSLLDWIAPGEQKALVFGTGGAARAVCAVLEDLHVPYIRVSRKKRDDILTYADLKADKSFLKDHKLIINATPLGMFPEVNTLPDIDYTLVGPEHFLYDLVYNPDLTLFLKKGFGRGASIKNGFEMLHLQAEKSWEIWSA